MLETLGNREWVQEHEAALKALFPKTWTQTFEVNFLAVAFQLKVLGVPSKVDDLPNIMAFFETIGIVERNDTAIRAGQSSIFLLH